MEGYFERHGGKTILIGRFIGLVRALAPFVAGSSGMAFRRFIPFSVVGTGLWATTFCVLGYIFWRSFDQVAHIAGQAIFGFGLWWRVIVGVVVAYRRRARDQGLAARPRAPSAAAAAVRLARPLYRRVILPLARVLAPQVRFLWDRLTPGGLGLELTTALAVGGVGLYVFVLYTVILSRRPRSHPARPRAARPRRPLARRDGGRCGEGGERLRRAADLRGARGWPRRCCSPRGGAGRSCWCWCGGFVLIYVAVHVAKAGIDRPRPAAPLVATEGSSFPSGHAAYATVWIAVAFVLTRRLGAGHRRQRSSRWRSCSRRPSALSRIYLRAHYWSDVAGGLGPGRRHLRLAGGNRA